MENNFLKNLKSILLQYLLFKPINLDFSKIFILSKNEFLKFGIFLAHIQNLVYFFRIENNIIIL